jgi:hypothetical protein
MNSGQDDAGNPARKDHTLAADTGVFLVTSKEAPRNYGLGTPFNTLAKNLGGARAKIVRYGPKWQGDLRAAIIEVRGPGPARGRHEARDIEKPVNELLVKWGHPADKPATARRIAQELKLFR